MTGWLGGWLDGQVRFNTTRPDLWVFPTGPSVAITMASFVYKEATWTILYNLVWYSSGSTSFIYYRSLNALVVFPFLYNIISG